MTQLTPSQLLTRVSGLFARMGWRDENNEALRLVRLAEANESLPLQELGFKVSGTFLATNDVTRDQVVAVLNRELAGLEIYVASQLDPTRSEGDRRDHGGRATEQEGWGSRAVTWLERWPPVRLLLIVAAVMTGVLVIWGAVGGLIDDQDSDKESRRPSASPAP